MQTTPPLPPKDCLCWEKAHGGLIRAEKWMPLEQVGRARARLRGSSPPAHLALSRRAALARAEQRWQRHRGLAREAAEIESRALGCCHFTAPS